MPTITISRHDAQNLVATGQRRSLQVVWQNPETRRFVNVAQIEELSDGKLVFEYLPTVQHLTSFNALAEFPQLDSIYLVNGLPAFLSNRIMSMRRPSAVEYRNWLGLDGVQGDLPIEILVRTGGARVTDTFHIVQTPTKDQTTFSSRFFVSGIRHVPGALERLEQVHPDDLLELIDDTNNPANPDAALLAKTAVGTLGWVPDWLVGEVRAIQEEFNLVCTVEKVNLDAPMHLRLLVKMDGVRRAG